MNPEFRDKYKKHVIETDEQFKELTDGYKRLSFNTPTFDGFFETYVKKVNGKLRLFDGLTQKQLCTIKDDQFVFPSTWYELTLVTTKCREQKIHQKDGNSKLLKGTALW